VAEGSLGAAQDLYDGLEKLHDRLAVRQVHLRFPLLNCLLPSDARNTYRALASRVQRIWRVGQQVGVYDRRKAHLL